MEVDTRAYSAPPPAYQAGAYDYASSPAKDPSLFASPPQIPPSQYYAVAEKEVYVPEPATSVQPLTSTSPASSIPEKDPNLYAPPSLLPGTEPYTFNGIQEKGPNFFAVPPQSEIQASDPQKDPNVYAQTFPPSVQPQIYSSEKSQDLNYFAPPPTAQPKVKDEIKTGSTKRFLGDTLVGRFARSAVQTTTNTLRVTSYLSPWGDNNTVTLPNVRYRDAALFATFSFIGAPLLESGGDALAGGIGCDHFACSVIDPVVNFFVYNTVAKYALFQLIEQAIDRGILEHILPEEEKMIRTTSMRTLQGIVKHKLMDVDTDIKFWGSCPAPNPGSCEKGWFAPYFFASNRTPKISRNEDFAVGQFFGPFLKGDQLLGQKLLSECGAVISLCNPDPDFNIGCKRLLVTFLGITSYRAGMWSTSRRPGASLINYHLLNGCPAIVIPVNDDCPITAWSTTTLATVLNNPASSPGHPQISQLYNPESHHEAICTYLDSIISMQHVTPKLAAMYEVVLGRAVSMLVNGMLGVRNVTDKKILKGLDPERAGVGFFRY